VGGEYRDCIWQASRGVLLFNRQRHGFSWGGLLQLRGEVRPISRRGKSIKLQDRHVKTYPRIYKSIIKIGVKKGEKKDFAIKLISKSKRNSLL